MEMAKIRVVLVAIISTIVFHFSASAASGPSAAVLIYLYSENQDSPAKAELLFQNFRKQLADDSSITEFRLVKARTSEELSKEISKLKLPSGVKISKLLITTHGASGHRSIQIVNSEDQLDRVIDTTYVRFNDVMIEEIHDDPNALHPLTELKVSDGLDSKDGLTQLQSEMADEVDVYCTACNILSGDSNEAKEKAKLIVDTLGVKNGRLYGNKVYGYMSKATLERPFWNHDTLKSKLKSILGQGALLYTVIGGIFWDPHLLILSAGIAAAPQVLGSFILNRGYEVQIKNGDVESISPETSNAFAAKFFNKASCSKLLSGFKAYTGW